MQYIAKNKARLLSRAIIVKGNLFMRVRGFFLFMLILKKIILFRYCKLYPLNLNHVINLITVYFYFISV
jgi:hypothetical protein